MLALGALLAFGMATQDKEGFEPAPVVGSPAQVLEAKGADCWTEPADHPADLAGEDPGSVVINGGEFTDARTIHKVVEQAYFGIDHNLRIYGFCR